LVKGAPGPDTGERRYNRSASTPPPPRRVPARRPAILDIRLIREKPDEVRAALARRGDAEALSILDEIAGLDARRREAQRRADTLRAQLNAASKTFGALKGRAARGQLQTADVLKSPDAAHLIEGRANGERPVGEVLDMLQDALRTLSEDVDTAVKETADVDAAVNERLLYLPNLPHPSVPDGRSSEDNVVVRTWGEQKSFDFQPLPHWDLGPALGTIDFDRGVRMSGSRFYVLKGRGAKLQRALIQWMLDVHVNEHGYTEVYPPFIVTEETLRASGQLPKFKDNLYHDAEDDVWLVPTAEVPLTSMHRGEILEPGQLPLNYVAYTPSFRREKMSAGRDIRGIKRGHQFDKVEIYKFTEAERSLEELESLTRDATDILERLGLTYRVVALCAGDLGQAAAKTYDLEVWAPGCGEWLEVSSASTTEDYQARRANIRYRPEPNARPRFVHTLNASGLALPRLMIAVLETYQQRDGSVVVPEAVRGYVGFERIG
jgi:seryl-tRNA synthetase